MIHIVPSIASADQLKIYESIKLVESMGTLHLDIEDGNFSPDITFGMDMAEQIAANTSACLDAHLMVSHPLHFIEPLAKIGVQKIAVHLESTEYPSQCLEQIHHFGCQAGLALNYKTPVSSIEPYLEQIDYLLLQSGEAGDPALAFKTYTLKKIREAKRLFTGMKIDLWVDGGINNSMLKELETLGVDYAVMGRAVFQKAKVTL